MLCLETTPNKQEPTRKVIQQGDRGRQHHPKEGRRRQPHPRGATGTTAPGAEGVPPLYFVSLPSRVLLPSAPFSWLVLLFPLPTSYIFEDNEAVIRMIMKVCSSNLRHVSRTHRVDLDLSFERINKDSDVSIRHVCTTAKLADVCTTGAIIAVQMAVADAVVRHSSIAKSHCRLQRFIIILFCSLLATPHAMWNAHNSQHDFESGPWEEKLEDSSLVERSAW